jgi:hypothetical protein
MEVSEKSILNHVYNYLKMNEWDWFALETSDNKLIPVLLRPPTGDSKEFVIVYNPEGKDSILTELVDGIIKSGNAKMLRLNLKRCEPYAIRQVKQILNKNYKYSFV